MAKKPRSLWKGMKRDTKDNIQYYFLMAIPLLLMFIFSYLPMFGIILAFKDYRITPGAVILFHQDSAQHVGNQPTGPFYGILGSYLFCPDCQ